MTIDQAWKILQLAISDIIQSIEINDPNLAGKDKKTIALQLLSTFYDSVFLVINIPFVPNFMQPIIRNSIKKLLMLLAGATIDAMVTTFRNTGVFSQSTKSDQ